MGWIEKIVVLLVTVFIICCTTTIHVEFSAEEDAVSAAEPASVAERPDARLGRVTGQATDAGGRPVTRFSVRAVSAPRAERDASGLPRRVPEQASVGASPSVEVVSVRGEFALKALAPGRYRVRVDAMGFEPATSAVVVVAPGGEAPRVAIRLVRTRPGR